MLSVHPPRYTCYLLLSFLPNTGPWEMESVQMLRSRSLGTNNGSSGTPWRGCSQNVGSTRTFKWWGTLTVLTVLPLNSIAKREHFQCHDSFSDSSHHFFRLNIANIPLILTSHSSLKRKPRCGLLASSNPLMNNQSDRVGMCSLLSSPLQLHLTLYSFSSFTEPPVQQGHQRHT